MGWLFARLAIGGRSTGTRLTETELTRLLEVGRTLGPTSTSSRSCDRCSRRGGELTYARYAALGILDERGQEVGRLLFIGIDDDTRRAIGPLPRGRGVLGS